MQLGQTLRYSVHSAEQSIEHVSAYVYKERGREREGRGKVESRHSCVRNSRREEPCVADTLDKECCNLLGVVYSIFV